MTEAVAPVAPLDKHISLTSTIVASYVGHNAVASGDLPALIKSVHRSLTGLGTANADTVPEQAPAVPIKKSVTPEFIVCLEDGKKFKSLKRHLATHFSMTPDQYREKWKLPADYPMVAPSYSAQRSQLAKDNGLGRKN